MSRSKRVAIALAWGFTAHATFAVAVATMVFALYHGLRTGRGTLSGWSAWAANLALLAQFPLLHSWLLSASGRRWLARLAPAELARDLAPTTFALIGSLQVLATFALWSPIGPVLHEASGTALWLFRGLFAASWLFLVKALWDAGLGLQTGSIGWTAVLRGRPVEYGPFPTHGLFERCRQPVYLGFALTLWTGPVHTLDGLVLACAWTAYCVLGPLHKEARYLRLHGARFASYRQSIPYLLPRIKS
jgi:hypothetical protein